MKDCFDVIQNYVINTFPKPFDEDIVEYYFDDVKESNEYVIYSGFTFVNGLLSIACGSSVERDAYNKITKKIERKVDISNLKFSNIEIPLKYKLPEKYNYILSD